MMTPLYTVAWPKRPPPDIYEIRFSYEFCRRKSRTACEKAGIPFLWLEYSGDLTLARLLRQLKGPFVLLISQPELILSSTAIKGLVSGLPDTFHACGPVFNATSVTHQLAPLPVSYLDMDSYEEVANELAKTQPQDAFEANHLDPACIQYRTEMLSHLSSSVVLPEILPNLKADPHIRFGVVPGALVHQGFLESFDSSRHDLVRLVPKNVHRVLDIGCAGGGYAKNLKRQRPEVFIAGIELNPILAAMAKPHYDELMTASVEDLQLNTSYDLINCGDILEHLQDPWALLTKLHNLLKPGGYLVMSIPNAGHWTIVRQLLRGEFEYLPLGPLCIGHLRWFTEGSIRRDLDMAGFFIDRLEHQQIPPTPEGHAFIRALAKAVNVDEESLFTNEFIIRAITM